MNATVEDVIFVVVSECVYMKSKSHEPTACELPCWHIKFCDGLNMTVRERSGSVVECLTRDREAAGSSLTSVTVLWSLSKTHLY